MRVLKITEPKKTFAPMLFVQLENDEGYTLEVGAYGKHVDRLKVIAPAIGTVSQYLLKN